MRGTLGVPCFNLDESGIIPAHAGNTARQAHAQTVRQGSSPHMRGTPFLAIPIAISVGIIPAHAGNTGCPGWPSWRGRDHPRTCGEHEPKRDERDQQQGSSPHMRGTLFWLGCAVCARGIIPAHAGNTRSTGWASPPTKDHPRTCGEHDGGHGPLQGT